MLRLSIFGDNMLLASSRRSLIAGLVLVTAASPSYATPADPESDRIRASADQIVSALASFKAVQDRFEQGQKLRADRETLVSAIKAKEAERDAAQADQREAVEAELRRLEADYRALQAKLDLAASESERNIAADVACFRVSAAMRELRASRRSAPPTAPTDDLLSAAAAAIAAIQQVESLVGCTEVSGSKEVEEYYNAVVNKVAIGQRERNALELLATNLQAVEDVTDQQEEILGIVDDAAAATKNLSEASAGNFETLTDLATNMQLFKTPESSFEKVDAVRTGSALLTAVGGVLLASGKASEWGDGARVTLSIGSIAGAITYFASDAIKVGKIPGPVRSMAGAVATNRMVGLAVQDIQSELSRSQALAKEATIVSTDETAPVTPAPADPIADPTDQLKQATSKFRAVVDGKRAALNGSGTTLSPTDLKELADANDVFQREIGAAFGTTEERFRGTIGTVAAARGEVVYYRSYVQSLKTAADRLRQLLGTTAEEHCEPPADTYKDFCDITVRGANAYALSGLLDQVNPEAVQKMVEIGQGLAAQEVKSRSLLNASIQSIDRISARAGESWQQYTTAIQRYRTGVSTLVSSIR